MYMNNSKRLADLRRLDEKSFAVTEWNLYLDTHPGDMHAASAFRRALNDFKAEREQFINNYGPLSCTDGAGKAWVNDPWPWDNEGCGC